MGNCIHKKKTKNDGVLSTKEIHRLFKEFDADGDGNITPQELERALNNLGINPSSLELRTMFLAADKNRDGHINIDEFKEIVRNCPALSELQRSFRQYDLDGDGTITVTEFKKALAAHGERVSEAEVQALFAAADADNDNKISFSEFAQIMRGRPLTLNLREVFNQFDIDNDGFITAAELRTVCHRLNIGASDREIELMFRSADENGDGKLTFDEFSSLLTKGKFRA